MFAKKIVLIADRVDLLVYFFKTFNAPMHKPLNSLLLNEPCTGHKHFNVWLANGTYQEDQSEI